MAKSLRIHVAVEQHSPPPFLVLCQHCLEKQAVERLHEGTVRVLGLDVIVGITGPGAAATSAQVADLAVSARGQLSNAGRRSTSGGQTIRVFQKRTGAERLVVHHMAGEYLAIGRDAHHSATGAAAAGS